MSTEKKLESPEELLSLYNDLDRLRNYKYFQPVVTTINNEGFYMDLPYEEIKCDIVSVEISVSDLYCVQVNCGRLPR